jgi:hypothetical protein
MKRIGFLLLVLLVSCSSYKKSSMTGLSYEGPNIYYKGEMCARLSAIEMALDNGKLVKEATYSIEDPKFNHLAVPIISYIRKQKRGWEVEIDFKYYEDIYK